MVLLLKKDNLWCFCIDYRCLNDSYPLTHIDEALDYVGSSWWFSLLDLRNRYWQVELAPGLALKPHFQSDKDYGSFATCHL